MPTRAATIEFVTGGLDDLDAGRAGPVLAHMAAAWTAGDLAELERYARWCDCLDTAAERASMKRLLDDRNPLPRGASTRCTPEAARSSRPSAACT